MGSTPDESDFWSENLQESIQAAGQQSKTLFCFISDGSEQSNAWENVISDTTFETAIRDSSVRLRLYHETQEFDFLKAVCPVQNIPALVLIKNGQIEDKIESTTCTLEQLRNKLAQKYSTPGVDIEQPSEPSVVKSEQCLKFAPSSGRMRLPNNAYDALKERTDKLQQQKISPQNILKLQLHMLNHVPALKTYVDEIRSRPAGSSPTLSEELISRLLNTPASMLQPRQTSSASTPHPVVPAVAATASSSTATSNAAPSPPPERAPTPAAVTESYGSQASSSVPSTSTQQSQRTDYLRQQRERESSQRSERDRIKAQIKADREERRRIDSLRKQTELSEMRKQNSTTSAPSSTDIRVQVRTFDGSTLRTTFANTATITNDVRPWVEETNTDANRMPYNLKLILTPLPNRDIEASEEEQTLPDLGIVGSATLVMVPVKTYVDSYTGGSTGVAGSVIGGLMGAVTGVVGGALGMLGWGSTPTATTPGSSQAATTVTDGPTSSGASVKVRTLADQRAEEAKRRGNQLYNGNSLDFQGRKDDDDRKRD